MAASSLAPDFLLVNDSESFVAALNFWIKLGSGPSAKLRVPNPHFSRRLNFEYYQVATKYYAFLALLNLT